MELYEAIAARRSIRRYKPDAVPRETVLRILEAARLAPSWSNRQCHRYYIVSEPHMRAALGELIGNPSKECYENAPYALILCADPTDSGVNGGKEYYLVDCGISMEHVMLAAAAEGLGTCWVGHFPENPVRNLFGISMDMRVVAITPLGYADEAPGPREREPLENIVRQGPWSELHHG